MNSRTKKLAPPRCQRQQWLRDVCQRLSVALMLVMLTTMTAWAQGAPAEYTITYVLYGGTNNASNPATYTCESADITLDEPTAPANSGYTFDGWYTDANFENEVNGTAIPHGSTGEQTFYAKWLTTVTATVVWSDENNTEGFRPESVTVKLMNGEEIGSVSLNASNNRSYTWTGLPTHQEGEAITYTVTEDAVDNYSTTIEGFTITNSRTVEMTTATLNITWNDFTDKYRVRPASVTATLSDGTNETSYPLDNNSNPLTCTVNDLQKYKNGTEINYSWTITDEIDCYEQSEPQVEGTTTTFTMNLIDHGDCRQPGSEAAVNWSYNTTTKTITIGGSGPMMYYNSVLNDDQSYSNGAPWKAFAGEIESVIIENGVTSVGSNTFAHCPHISSVTLPTDQHLYEVGPGAFGDCTSLTSIDLPMSVNKIDDGAFAGCSNLKTVTLHYGDGATFTIGTDVFPATTSIIVPLAALQSYYNAESWASYKEQIVAGLCGKKESDHVTWTLTRLATDLKVPSAWEEVMPGIDNPTAWTTVPAYKLTISGTGAMADYDGEGVTTPWAAADFSFYDVGATYESYSDKSAITELEIGAGITALGSNAFNGLLNLKSLTIADGTALTTIDPYDFFTDNLTTVSLPEEISITVNDGGTLQWLVNSDAWRPYYNQMTPLGGYCGTTANDADGKNLSWKLAWNGEDPDSNGRYPLTLTITGTGAMADYGYSNETQAPWGTKVTILSLPDGLTTIGKYAFYRCTISGALNIPESVISIDDKAFCVNYDLTAVTIPGAKDAEGNALTTIGFAAFELNENLATVTLGDGVKAINEAAFQSTGLTAVTIPNSVESIGYWAFLQCESLKTVTMLGETPPALIASAFANCTLLGVILVPNETAYANYMSAPTWNGEGENTTDYTSMLAPSTITLAGNTSGWATYCHNYIVSYSVKDGAAYTVSGINNSSVQTAAADYVAPYTPTLVYKSGGNVTLTALPATATQNVPTNYNTTTGLVTQDGDGFTFVGATTTPVEDCITDGQSYALYGGEFLKIDDSTLDIPAHRCILTLAATSAPRLSIVQDSGEMTGIDSISTESGSQGVFGANAEGNTPSLRNSLDRRNLSGQRVGAGYKGIVIVNGRKVVIK